MVKESVVQIQDVGPIKLVDIPLGPGRIIKFVGDNGAGKSTAIRAVTSAISGEKNGLTPRDGKQSGKIRLPGRTVTVGARMKSTPTGEVAESYVIVEDGSGITKILKPGIKDPEAADKKRLEGVLEVIGATLSIDQQREFLGDFYAGFAVAKKVADLPFVDTVKAMKLYLEEVARTHTKKVDETTGAISLIGDVAKDVELEESSESISRRLIDLSTETRDAARARDTADAALRELENIGDAQALPAAEKLVEKTRVFIAENEEKLRDIQESLAEARLILVNNEAIIDAVQKVEVEREAMRKVIDKAKSSEEIDVMMKQLKELTELHTQAVVASADNDRREKERSKLAELKSVREKSEASRDSIKTMIGKLPTLLHKAMETVPGWTVDEEFRLCVEHARGQIPFSELSPGEGTSRVCLLACQFAKCAENELPIVGLPQECFEGLDGTNRQLLLESAQEHGLCILTAEASEEHVDGIRVDVLK